MSVRLVCDRLIVDELPFKLDPLHIATRLLPANSCGEATFASSVIVRYTPNVSSETPGQTVLAVFTRGVSTVREAHAAACKVISPIWKSSSLVIPKDLLRFEDWSRSSQPSLWLSCVNPLGTVDISCTIKCAVQFKLTPTPTLEERISTLTTKCFLGPVLSGFSFIGCMPSKVSATWGGNGNVININLKNGTGITTGNRWIRTPETRDYVAVRYGFGNSFGYSYTSANQKYSWQSFSYVLSKYTNAVPAPGSADVYFTGSWRPIKGSTSWWAEINPTKETSTGPYYHPCAQLILYYEYPGINVFSPDFTPSIRVRPGDMLPCPPGTMLPNLEQNLPLNHSRLQIAWNAGWKPQLTNSPFAVEMFQEAKEDFTAWPFGCSSVPIRGTSSDIYECDEGQDKSDDAEHHDELGSLTTDHSV